MGGHWGRQRQKLGDVAPGWPCRPSLYQVESHVDNLDPLNACRHNKHPLSPLEWLYWVCDFDSTPLVSTMQPEAVGATHPLCRPFRMESFGILAPTAARPSFPSLCCTDLAQGHPHCPLLHHLGNEPLLSISCPEWLSETRQGAFYWSWEIGKHLNFSCTKILLFSLKWLFKYCRQVYTQMDILKCM